MCTRQESTRPECEWMTYCVFSTKSMGFNGTLTLFYFIIHSQQCDAAAAIMIMGAIIIFTLTVKRTHLPLSSFWSFFMMRPPRDSVEQTWNYSRTSTDFSHNFLLSYASLSCTTRRKKHATATRVGYYYYYGTLCMWISLCILCGISCVASGARNCWSLVA